MDRPVGTPIFRKGIAGTVLMLHSRPAHVHGIKFVNEGAGARFLQVFDAAAAGDVTLGTTAPDVLLVAGVNGVDKIEVPISFTKGVAVAATTTALGSTGAAANTAHATIVVV